MSLQQLDFSKDKDAIIARLILQRINVYLECNHTENLFSVNEANVINKFAIESDKEHYSEAMNHINNSHYIDSECLTNIAPQALPTTTDTPTPVCDSVAVSCD